jgi:hypothetical protein
VPSPAPLTVVLPVLPRKLRATFAENLERRAGVSVAERDALAASLAKHLVAIRAATRRNEFVDVELGERVARSCAALLELWENLSVEGRALVAACVDYFAQQQDADDDFASPIGFEDDAAVVSAVARALARPDLVVEPSP